MRPALAISRKKKKALPKPVKAFNAVFEKEKSKRDKEKLASEKQRIICKRKEQSKIERISGYETTASVAPASSYAAAGKGEKGT